MMCRLQTSFLSHYCSDESHPNFVEILYQVVVLPNGWIWHYKSTYFSKITEVEVCQVIDQAKIALIVVQN